MHRFDSLGSEDVKQLAVISPAIMGAAYFREAAEVIDDAAGGPPDREKMMDVVALYNQTSPNRSGVTVPIKVQLTNYGGKNLSSSGIVLP
ncbi:MAG: hypothetical protein ACJ74Z_22370 [Bryobacteraceae bacterium]